jgi:ribosomal protein S18 acetylase RimI-like enzyme
LTERVSRIQQETTADTLPTSEARVATIRVAEPGEWADVGEATYLGFNHGQPGAPEPAPERLRLLKDAAARAAEGDLLIAVDPDPARNADTIVGTASLLRPGSSLSRQAVGDEAEVRLLAVVPSARRRGLGQALMREALDRARAWGVSALVLDTGPNNTASQALYLALGFERVPGRETKLASSGGYLAVFRYAFDKTAAV